MLKNFVLFSLLCLTPLAVADEGIWRTLAKLSWNDVYDDVLGMDVSQPVFSDEIKKLNGKTVTVKGYLLPVDVGDQQMVLSAFPFANCFFCGGAGPETVMQIDLKKNTRLYNKRVTVRGKLKLNDQDFLSLIYALEKTEMVMIDP